MNSEYLVHPEKPQSSKKSKLVKAVVAGLIGTAAIVGYVHYSGDVTPSDTFLAAPNWT